MLWERWKIVVASAFCAVVVGILWSRGHHATAVGLIAFPAFGAPFMLDSLRRTLHDLLMVLKIDDRLGPEPVVADEEES